MLMTRKRGERDVNLSKSEIGRGRSLIDRDKKLGRGDLLSIVVDHAYRNPNLGKQSTCRTRKLISPGLILLNIDSFTELFGP